MTDALMSMTEDTDREAFEDERAKWELDQEMASKIGYAFGIKRPRIQKIGSKTLRHWWTQAAGPFRTDKAARRMARTLRDKDSEGRVYGVWEAPIEDGRTTADWFVAVRVGQAPGPKRGPGK